MLFIWPEIKRALLASIDKDPSQWSAYYSLILAALFRGGIGELRPAGESRDTTVWRAFLRTAFQSLVEKSNTPKAQTIPHRPPGRDVCEIFDMAKDTVQWQADLTNAPMMWTNIAGNNQSATGPGLGPLFRTSQRARRGVVPFRGRHAAVTPYR